MYGVSADLDLTFLHKAEVIQICFGLYQLQVHFFPEAVISVEADWELLDESGLAVEAGSPLASGGSCRLLGLLGRRVASSEVSAPSWFALVFDGGLTWRVYDSHEGYESFSIAPGNIFV